MGPGKLNLTWILRVYHVTQSKPTKAFFSFGHNNKFNNWEWNHSSSNQYESQDLVWNAEVKVLQLIKIVCIFISQLPWRYTRTYDLLWPMTCRRNSCVLCLSRTVNNPCVFPLYSPPCHCHNTGNIPGRFPFISLGPGMKTVWHRATVDLPWKCIVKWT